MRYPDIFRFEIDGLDDRAWEQRVSGEGFANHRFPDPVYVRPQPFGFFSTPPVGSFAWAFAPGGQHDRVFVMGGEHPDHRPLNSDRGLSGIYDANGRVVRFFADRIEVEAKGTLVLVKSTQEVRMQLAPNRFNRFRPGRIDLMVKDPNEQASGKVMTTDGPSDVVFARVD